MMNENEINKILELTRKKIAISQFKQEEIEEVKVKRDKKIIALKKLGMGIAAGVVLSLSSVGAYAGITGNKEILKSIGINIGEQY